MREYNLFPTTPLVSLVSVEAFGLGCRVQDFN